jgi:hypothetical protein
VSADLRRLADKTLLDLNAYADGTGLADVFDKDLGCRERMERK